MMKMNLYWKWMAYGYKISAIALPTRIYGGYYDCPTLDQAVNRDKKEFQINQEVNLIQEKEGCSV